MKKEVFAYARVSTRQQDLARQLQAFKEMNIDERNIVIDKQSGKDFNRQGYNSLVGTHETSPLLRSGDMLVIYSIDRLGRNYNEIMKEWQHITKEIGADIKVIDMPLLDTSKGNNDLDSRFVADLVLQILSYVANKERENILARQAAGNEAMKATCKKVERVSTDEKRKKAIGDMKCISNKTGKPIGRPEATFPEEWETVYQQWKAGEITAVSAMEKLNLRKNTFYNLVKRFEAQG